MNQVNLKRIALPRAICWLALRSGVVQDSASFVGASVMVKGTEGAPARRPPSPIFTSIQPWRLRGLLASTDIVLPFVVLVVIAVLASLMIRYGDEAVLTRAAPASLLSGSGATAPAARQPLTAGETSLEHARVHMEPGYRCPAHSEILSTVPGSCPVCGKVLQWAGGGESGRLDLRAAVMTAGRPPKRLFFPQAGWVEQRLVEVGAEVERGAALLELYAPGLSRSGGREEALVRLQAPVAGRVRAIHAERGQFIAAERVVVEIEDRGSLWLKAAVADGQLPRLRQGQPVELLQITPSGVPLMGEVEEVVPGAAGAGAVWLRFDGNPLPEGQAEADIRILL